MKRKKKEDDGMQDPKPKKYKKKIENPEKKRARYVYDNKANNGKVWEKNRRDRLNTTFDDLALLLPPKEPPGKLSKVEILVAAIKEIGDLRSKVHHFEQNINQNEETSNTEQIKLVRDMKDVACNTDIEDKENNFVLKRSNLHKKVQVNMLRKKKMTSGDKSSVSTTSNVASVKPIVSSSATQTLDVENNAYFSSDSLANTSRTSTNKCMTLVPFSYNNAPLSEAITTQMVSSESTDTIHTASNAAFSLSSSMRITPALISTPIMTPSLFISNYPFVVSQVPQSVLIVNKTEVNTTVNKVVAVKSKTINGRIPLPPLKKSVAVKKPPRKKRLLKKKSNNVEDIQTISENREIITAESSENLVREKSAEIINDIKDIGVKEKGVEKSETKDIPDVSKEIDQNSEKHLEDLSLPITPLLISSGKMLERLDSNSSLLNLESHRKSYSPVPQDISHINDTSAISNLDIESFSLLTANILSGIDANDTSETNLSSNLGKVIEDKNHDCTTKTDSLTSISNEAISSERIGHVVTKEKPIDKSINEGALARPRETIQVRKGLLQIDSNLGSQQNAIGSPNIAPILSTSSYNCSTVLTNTTQSTNYPSFPLSFSQDVRSSKPVESTEVITAKSDASATYIMNGATHSTNLNYSGYYCNSNSVHTSLHQLYTNQHSNNITSTSYSKAYDSPRSYYTDQPSTNFTFSLTSAGKSRAKYISAGTKQQNVNHTQLPNVQETCKKFISKSATYTYSAENVKNVTSHSIARLNSKYENHKENNTPFYLSQDAACKKEIPAQKPVCNQTLFTNNSSCARYPHQQQLQAPSKQASTNKPVKSSLLSTPQPQMSSRYDIDWMSSSEIKPSTNDFQLFPSLDAPSAPMNQNSYYSSSVSNLDVNRKTSDLYFAHPPGEENLPWSPSRMSNLLDAPHISGNQCFPTTLPNLHGDLALNTFTAGGYNRPGSILETPTKTSVSSYNASYSAAKDTKKVSNTVDVQQNNSFSVRTLVDMNQSSKSSVSSDKMANTKRKISSQKEGEGDNFSSDIIPYENQKSNIYSAESLINPRHGSKSKSWQTETGHAVSSNDPSQNNSLFLMESTGENQNYAMARYEPKFFNQNYVPSFVDNSFSNTSQNFHNFSKSQPFPFVESNNHTIDYHQSSLGSTMSTFLSHPDVPEKITQHYYPQSSKSINPINMDTSSSRTNNHVAATSHSNKKSKSSHHVPTTTTHHSLIMNYDFPVTPVTPSLSYFSSHEWKSTPPEPYPAMHHNPCNSNSYVNSSNFYSQNILQNSQTQNLVTGLGNSNVSNNNQSQNTSNSLTNFNLSTICPEINDKVRHQNW